MNALRTPWMVAAAALMLTACSEDKGPGEYWEVDLVGLEDTCTGNMAGYSDSLLYRIERGTADLTLAVDQDVFATGTQNGCVVSYQSVIWTEEREGSEISWQITGTAQVESTADSDTCGIEGFDWLGTETFEVISSTDEAIRPGCTYSLEVKGNFIEEVP